MKTIGKIIIQQYKDQRWIDPIWYNNGTQKIKQQQSIEHPRQDDRKEVIQEDGEGNR
jgi:hypothetical protein